VRCTELGPDSSSDVVLHAGAYFGERALITDEPRGARVLAEGEVREPLESR
jgi:hypothetical protein